MHVYVMFTGSGWGVKRDNEDNYIFTHEVKNRAIEAAKEIALGHDAELVILRKDGTIDNLGVYGIDPLPSKNNAPEYNDEDDEDI